jgi:hypothetical protein
MQPRHNIGARLLGSAGTGTLTLDPAGTVATGTTITTAQTANQTINIPNIGVTPSDLVTTESTATLNGAITLATGLQVLCADPHLTLGPVAGNTDTINVTTPAAPLTHTLADFGVNGTFALYEQITHTSDYVDDTGIVTYSAAYDHIVTRMGNSVFIRFPLDLITMTGASIQIRTLTMLPARFRPGSNLYWAKEGSVSGVNSVCKLVIEATGQLTWYSDPIDTPWAGAANDGFYASCVSYTV